MNLPINRAAEVAIIGCCFSGGLDAALKAGELIPAKCFYHDDVRFVFEAIMLEANHGRQADTLGILNRWKAHYPLISMPQDLLGADADAWLLQNRAETVLDLFRRRQAMIAADALLRGAESLGDPLTDAMSEFNDIMENASTNAPPLHDARAAALLLGADLEKRFELNGKLSGIDCGLSGLNAITDGLQPGEFWIIGARPNVGKTALMLNIAEHVSINQGIPSLIVTLEMSMTALCRRLASMRGEINGNSIRRGQFTETEFKSLTMFNSKFAASPMYFLDSPGGVGITQLIHSIRSAIRRYGIKVVFIDYLQKIRGDGKSEKRTYEIGEVSSRLVELTKREQINLFALAQLNRESEKEKGRAPKLSDLADSKSIEADADFVGLLDRPILNDETKATLRVAKQRDGERGTLNLTYRGWHCRFTMGQWEFPSVEN